MKNQITFAPAAGNNTPAAAALAGRLVPGKENTVSLQNAVYTFDKAGATVRDMTASGAEKAEKNVIFDFENVSDLTVDGNGAQLLFRDRVTPFAFHGCKNLTLKNFTIDFSFSRYCQGVVTASDETGFTLFIDPALFAAAPDGAGHMVFTCGSDTFSTRDTEVLLANEVFGRPPWDYIFAGDSTLSKEGLATTYLETDALPAGENQVRFAYRPGSRTPVYPIGETLLFCYEPRENVNIFLEDCGNVRLQNINIYRGGGMGIVAHTSRDILCDKVRITVRPGRAECRSTTADGFYFVQCSGEVTVRNSEISHTLDDALNIHGIYNAVEAIPAPDRIIAKTCFAPHRGICSFAAGKKITVSDKTTLCEKQTLTVLSVEKLDATRTLLTLDGPADAAVGDYIESIGLSASFLFENNLVTDCPHIRVAGPAPKVIRNNVFNGLHAIAVNDLMEFWYESGCVKSMQITGNSFVDCPRSGPIHPISIANTRGAASGTSHRDFLIAGNSFSNASGHAIFAECVDGITVRDNTVSDDPQAIQLQNCTNVTCQ